MGKDPAFLFYYQDFAWGTRRMSLEQKGAYITLLCEQADIGHLAETDILEVLDQEFHLWHTIKNKYLVDKDGKFYNQVLEAHITKRKKYVTSRNKNLNSVTSSDPIWAPHMENVNVNVNESKDKGEYYHFEELWSKYPQKARVGKKAALKHYLNTVKTIEDLRNIKKALSNYLNAPTVGNGYVKNASTWFNNWEDYVDYKEKFCKKCKGTGKYTSDRGFVNVCSCQKEGK